MKDALIELMEAGERALIGAGARIWEICVTEEASASVEVVDGAVRAEESAVERAIGLRVLDGGIGFAGLADPTPSGLRRAAEAALAEARLVRDAALDGFARHSGGRALGGAPFDDPRVTGRGGARLIEVARSLEAATVAADRRVEGVRPAHVSEVRGRFRLRTSAGVDVDERSTRAFASVAALASDPLGEESQLAYAGSSAAAVEAIDLADIARKAAGRAVGRLGATGYRTAVVPVILAPEVVAELLEVIASALCGDLVDRGASFLAKALDQRVLGPELTLIDDPHDGALDGCAWLDGEGLPTRRTTLVERGVVRAILDDLETAARGKRRPGGHAQRGGAEGRPRPGAHSLSLAPGRASTAVLMRAAEGGLWIDEVSGTHTISEITGALSLGATGHVISGGAKGAPIEGVTLSGTLLDLFGPRARPGVELEMLGHARVPPVAIDAVQVASAD